MDNENTGHPEQPITWVTAADLARRHRVTPKTIRLWARSGAIPAIRYGSAWRFPLELVERTLLSANSAG